MGGMVIHEAEQDGEATAGCYRPQSAEAGGTVQRGPGGWAAFWAERYHGWREEGDRGDEGLPGQWLLSPVSYPCLP